MLGWTKWTWQKSYKLRGSKSRWSQCCVHQQAKKKTRYRHVDPAPQQPHCVKKALLSGAQVMELEFQALSRCSSYHKWKNAWTCQIFVCSPPSALRPVWCVIILFAFLKECPEPWSRMMPHLCYLEAWLLRLTIFALIQCSFRPARFIQTAHVCPAVLNRCFPNMPLLNVNSKSQSLQAAYAMIQWYR